MRLAALALAFLLCGCTSADPADAPPDAAEPAPAGTALEPLAWDAETVGSYCVWTDGVREGCFGVHQFPDAVTQELELPSDTLEARFEFTWSAADARTAELVAAVQRRGGVVQEVRGTSPLVLELEDISPGDIILLLYVPRPAGLPAQAHEPQSYHAEGLVTSRLGSGPPA